MESTESKAKTIAYPVPTDVLAELRKRKIEKGVSIKRSIEDALRFARQPAMRQAWF